MPPKYRVKLADKKMDKIRVDDITITHRWKLIPKKTVELKKLEKEGKIKIKLNPEYKAYPKGITGLEKMANEMNAVQKLIDSTLAGQVQKMMDSTLAGQVQKMMDSSLVGQAKAWMDSSLVGQAKAWMDSSLTGDSFLAQYQSLVGPATYNIMENCLESDFFNSRSLQMDLELSSKKFFYATMAESSFRYLEIAVNSMSIRRDIELGLMMSHNSMLEAVEALKLPIEELHRVSQGKAVEMALEELELTNAEIEDKILHLPPYDEDILDIEPAPLEREKKRDDKEEIQEKESRTIDFEKEEPEVSPPFYLAVKKEIAELKKPPDSFYKILELKAKGEKIDEQLSLKTIFDLLQKNNRLGEICDFHIFQHTTVIIENSITRVKQKTIKCIPWNGSKTQLKLLFIPLKKAHFLGDIEYNDFEIHFDINGSETPFIESKTDKIRWIGKQTQLLYLFQLLIKDDCLSKELENRDGDRWKMLADHFEKKDGTSLDNRQLARAWKNMESYNIDGKPKRATVIEKIVKDIKS